MKPTAAPREFARPFEKRFLSHLLRGSGALLGVLPRPGGETHVGGIEADPDSPLRGDLRIKRNWPAIMKHVEPRDFLGNPLETLKVIPRFLSLDRRLAGSLGRSSRLLEPRGPAKKKVKNPERFWGEFEELSRREGVDLVGYTPVPPNLIFKGGSIRYGNAVVLAMEMRKEEIDTAPRIAAGMEAWRVYTDLGDAACRLADFLLERGRGVQISHPMGGLLLYPPLAVLAGLGWQGRTGHLITPRFGPRQRLCAILTDAELPPKKAAPRTVGRQFCIDCGRCVKECPAGAFLAEPVRNGEGVYTRIDFARCFPKFAALHGCAVCLKVCPMGRGGRGTEGRDATGGKNGKQRIS